jgi:uncharacterized protein (DUF488 family)
MEIFTIGFAGRPAADFFEALKLAGIVWLIDVRLNNTSQLAGFTKRADLPYFLREICGAEYRHEPLLAPTQEMLDGYKKERGAWEDYERGFLGLMAERRIEERIDRALFQSRAALLCSERLPDHCHRRLIVEYLHGRWGGIRAVHL